MDSLISLHTLLNGQIIVVVALGIALFSMVVIVHCLKKQNALLKQVNKLSEELRIANRGAIGMGQQIIALEKQLQRMNADVQTESTIQSSPSASAINMSQLTDITAEQKSQQDSVIVSTAAKPSDSNISEDHVNDKLSLARDLLAKGKQLTEVANTCQLSFAEVSLLRALSANPAGTPPNQPHPH